MESTEGPMRFTPRSACAVLPALFACALAATAWTQPPESWGMEASAMDIELESVGWTLTPVAPSNLRGTAINAGRSVPYLPSAADPLGRQGFVRVVNRSERAGTVSITALDDVGKSYGPVVLALDASQTVYFNSVDLEDGNAGKGPFRRCRRTLPRRLAA